MRILPLHFLLVFFFVAFVNCKKDNKNQPDNPYGLPNATQKGAMIFACLINGQKMIAPDNPITLKGLITNDSINIQAGLGDANYFENIGIWIYGPGKINFPYDLSDSIKTSFYYDTDSMCFGVSSNIFTSRKAYGNLTFTRLDSIAKIISGIFVFRIPVPGCDTLNFTEGRFDIQYY